MIRKRRRTKNENVLLNNREEMLMISEARYKTVYAGHGVSLCNTVVLVTALVYVILLCLS